jgi:hypothetical protein
MQWTANGVQLNTTIGELQLNPSIVYIPSTGEVFAFFENTNSPQTIQGLYGQRLNQAGVRLWGGDARIILPMDNSTKMLIRVNIIEDDPVVTYLHTPPDDDVNSFLYSTRIDIYGNHAWDWEPMPMCNLLSSKGYLDARANNRNQVIAVWQDKRNDSDGDVYLQNINRYGELGPLGPLTGSLTGYVREDDGTTPIEDVIVTDYDSLDQICAIDTTGYLGVFDFIVPVGVHHLRFSNPLYRDTTVTGVIVTDGGGTLISVNMSRLSALCYYVLGDVNYNGGFNGIDVTYAVSYFKGGNLPPYSCYCNGLDWFVAGDVNGNCLFNGIDILYMARFGLRGHPLTPCPLCPPTE